jgi:hypothetical protein
MLVPYPDIVMTDKWELNLVFKLTGPLPEAMCTMTSDPPWISDFDANFGRFHLLTLIFTTFLVAQNTKTILLIPELLDTCCVLTVLTTMDNSLSQQ